MKTCRTCKHWLEYSLWGECKRLGGNMGGPDYEGTKAFAQDTGNQAAFFRCTGEFGCTEHEERTDGTVQ